MLIEFELISKKKTNQKLMVDYRIHYVKKNGALLPKVFKLKELALKPAQSVFIAKKQRFQDFTTRKHFPGRHRLELVVNGKVVKAQDFWLKK